MDIVDFMSLLRVRIPVPLPLFLGLMIFGAFAWIGEKLELDGKGQGGCFLLGFAIATLVGFLVYQAGYSLWPW